MTSELQKNKTLLVLALAAQPDTFCSPLVSQNPPSRPSTVREVCFSSFPVSFKTVFSPLAPPYRHLFYSVVHVSSTLQSYVLFIATLCQVLKKDLAIVHVLIQSFYSYSALFKVTDCIRSDQSWLSYTFISFSSLSCFLFCEPSSHSAISVLHTALQTLPVNLMTHN